MMQSFHIFRKDLRHQALVLSLYAAVLALFAYVGPLARRGVLHSNPAVGPLATLLNILIPLSWFLLTVRVVQEESLVGDRQFWTTRPYRWQCLLGAKLLFLALCIWLPFLLMQSFLALRAGLNPFNMGLLVGTFMTLFYLWLPSFLIASVTAALPAAFFVALATLVLSATTLGFLVGRDAPRTDAPWSFALMAALFAVLFLTALLHQYRKRDTRGTRVVLASCIALFFSVYLGYIQMPVRSMADALMLVRHRDTTPGLQLTYTPGELRFPLENKEGSTETRVSITLPIHLQGLDRDTRLINLNAAYTLEAGALRYDSPWRPVALNGSGVNLLIPRDVLHDMNTASAPKRLRLTLTGTTLVPASTRNADVSDSFRIGNGQCSNLDNVGHHLRCNFAFDVPDPIRIDPILSTPCAWTPSSANLVTHEAGLEADPVRVQILSMGDRSDCNIASVRATTYRRDKSFSKTLEVAAIDLGAEKAH